MSFTEKVDILDLLINVLNEHEKKMDILVKRIESIINVLDGHPEFSSAFQEYEEQQKVEEGHDRLRVLIVDDDEFLASTFQMLLEDSGFHVDIAVTGNDALIKSTQKKFDLAILDYKLPDIPGTELSRMLKERDADINVVMLTGHVEAVEGQFGDDEILMKPISPDELLKITDKLSNRG